MKTIPSVAALLALLGVAHLADARQEAVQPDDSSPSPVAGDAMAPTEAIPRESSNWRFEFDARIWAMGIEGDVAARGGSASVDASLVDILEASDSLIGLAGRIEAGRGRWSGFLDGLYNRIGVEDATGPLGLADVDVTLTMGLVDFGLMYRLGDWPLALGNSAAPSFALDAYAGGRYTSGSVEIDPELLPAVEQDKEWFDPIVGLKLESPLSKHFHVSTWGDIGGFGVSCDFTWSAAAILGFDFELFENPATVYGGYRAIGQDFHEGSGSDSFDWDVIMHGPMLGFTMSF